LRFEKEFAKWTKKYPDQVLAMEKQKKDKRAHKDKKKRKNKRKAAGMPKRAMSSYLFFTNDKRAGVTKKNKDAKMTDISKIMGEMWRNTDEKGRTKYLKQAEADKARYLQEKTAWDTAQENQDWLG
jgi:hypothetical protein